MRRQKYLTPNRATTVLARTRGCRRSDPATDDQAGGVFLKWPRGNLFISPLPRSYPCPNAGCTRDRKTPLTHRGLRLYASPVRGRNREHEGGASVTEKRAFLLAGAQKVVELQDMRNYYDELQQLNVRVVGSEPQPLVMDNEFGYTESKTHAAPSDDDPDRESEGCY